MESFHWDRHFETGLEAVDSQHHALVDLINRFGELITQSDVASADIEGLFVELTRYAGQHFREEEDMMVTVGIDRRHVDRHMQQHSQFLREVMQMHADLDGRQRHSEALLKFLTYWLAYHILGVDQQMARQVRAVRAGGDAQAAYLAESEARDGAAEPLLVALNGLFQLVSERNRDLQALNKTLEDKVAERTHSLSVANELLERIASTDVLTGLANRRHAMARFALSWSETASNGAPLSCVMLDADGFKQVNDHFGHDCGDVVLREVARQLRYAVRTDDVVCRLGGDEFLIICPATSLRGAVDVAEKVRREIALLQVNFRDDARWSGSVSVGVAERTAAMRSPEELIKAADEGLYIAKRNGRNRVECAPTSTRTASPTPGLGME